MKISKLIIVFVLLFLIPMSSPSIAAKAVYSLAKKRLQSSDFSDVDYIFICSSSPDLNAKAVSDFYSQHYPENKHVEVFDGIALEKIDESKKYLLTSFGIKPFNQSNIDCLEGFPEFPKRWIEHIGKQNDRVGTVFDHWKNDPIKKHIAPIQQASMYRFSDDKQILFTSSISLKSSPSFFCTSLADAFLIEHDLANCKLKSGDSGAIEKE